MSNSTTVHDLDSVGDEIEALDAALDRLRTEQRALAEQARLDFNARWDDVVFWRDGHRGNDIEAVHYRAYLRTDDYDHSTAVVVHLCRSDPRYPEAESIPISVDVAAHAAAGGLFRSKRAAYAALHARLTRDRETLLEQAAGLATRLEQIGRLADAEPSDG